MRLFCGAFLQNQRVFRSSYSSENRYHLHRKFQRLHNPTEELTGLTVGTGHDGTTMGGNSPLYVHRLVVPESPCQSLALSHACCQVLLCHINSQLFSESSSVPVRSYNIKAASATPCLVCASEGGDGVSTPLA